MKHRASSKFWTRYRALPLTIQKLADRCFQLLRQNSQHPSLHLKKVGKFWSARIGLDYRAVAVESDDGLLWFWIGPHDAYSKLIKGI